MLGSTYGMWEARDQICFWVVVEPWDIHATSCQLRLWESLCMPLDGGLLFHIKKKQHNYLQQGLEHDSPRCWYGALSIPAI